MRLRIPIINLLKDAQSTFLTNDFASGSSAITVQNIYGFGVNQILFISTNVGPLKNELMYQKIQIIQRVNEAFGEKVISHVVVE